MSEIRSINKPAEKEKNGGIKMKGYGKWVKQEEMKIEKITDMRARQTESAVMHA